MRRKFDKIWVEYRNLIGLMNHPSNIDAYELHLGDQKVSNDCVNEWHGFTLYK